MNFKGKVRRNAPCSCGSGKKYKKCHGVLKPQKINSPYPFDMKEIKQKLEEMKASEIQRTKQQGKGRPIISTVFKGYRFVAVGAGYYSEKEEKWQTFHDFLAGYIKLMFGKKWGSSEQRKPLEDRHPILQLAHSISEYRQKVLDERKGEIISSLMTGAVFAYLTLAYNLYLIAHNIHLVHGKGLHARLIKRLKNKESFYDAFYETMVAASFIKAGFQIELENENDSSSDHAEFTAISPKTNRRYSVEAKHRQANKSHTGISKQIYNALKKVLPHERVVFIDLNMQINQTSNGKLEWLDNVIGEMRHLENSELDGKPAPKAYIFVTNHPFLYNLDSFSFSPEVVAEGFKIPDFKIDSTFSNLRDALKSRENHIDMLDLMRAMKEYDPIPCTFDGEIPEYAFGEIEESRLKIGNKYLVPDACGKEVEGILEDTSVLENERLVYGVYRLENGQRIICASPITEKELDVYRKYTDTFFGVYKKTPKRVKDPLDWFDFFYDTYRNSTKEKLLEFLKGSLDFDLLKNETQQELAITFCERSVYSIMREDLEKRTTTGKVV